MIESATKSHIFFFRHGIDEQEPVRFLGRFLVHLCKLLHIHRIPKRVVDLFELRLITGLEHRELCGIETDQTRNTDPRLCE